MSGLHICILISEVNMNKAIAYMRFSSAVQERGDSLRRQRKLIDNWISQNHEYELDNVTYEDLGLSAFRGKHATSGAFAEFMDAINHRLILPGTVLLVESLDRLSREKIGEATERLKLILKAGVDVVTLCDGTHYTEDSLDDPYTLIKAILIAQRANEESEIKSSRIKKSWERKREDAQNKGTIMTRACPRWLKTNGSRTKFIIIEERAAIIRMIFHLRAQNRSLHWIAKYLNDNFIETMNGKRSEWGASGVEKILSNKALVGICCPAYRSRNNGYLDIPDYYPRVLSDDEFYSVQEVRLAPFGITNKVGSPYLINILRTVMRCGACGNTMIVTSVSATSQGYYVCPMRRLHRCEQPPIKRDIVDANLISQLLFNYDRLQFNEVIFSAEHQLQSKDIELRQQLNNLLEVLKDAKEVKPLSDLVRNIYKELRRNEVALKILQNKKRSDLCQPIYQLDLKVRDDREACRRHAFRTFKKITIYTATSRCNIEFSNGLKFLNYPLSRVTDVSGVIDALQYLDDDKVYF